MPTGSSTSDILTSELSASTSSQSDQLALLPGVYNVRPQDGAVCKIKLLAESEVGNYPLKEEFEFRIGESDSDIGEKLEKCLCQMMQGETTDFEFEKVQEENSSHSVITVKVSVSLVEFTNSLPIFCISRNEKLELACDQKEKGVELFKKESYDFAFKRFSKAMKFLILMLPREEIPHDLILKFNQLMLQCYSNMAACQLKTEKYDFVVENCTKALKLDGDNIKCLYRRAEAFFHLNQHGKCRADVVKGLKLDPRSRSLQQLLTKLTK